MNTKADVEMGPAGDLLQPYFLNVKIFNFLFNAPEKVALSVCVYRYQQPLDEMLQKMSDLQPMSHNFIVTSDKWRGKKAAFCTSLSRGQVYWLLTFFKLVRSIRIEQE